jgi:hypothetical protein
VVERSTVRIRRVAGELVRLAAVLKVFEGWPIEAATVHTDVLWAVVGEHGQRKRQGLV